MKNMDRRVFTGMGAAALVASAPRQARAADWPARPLRLIVPAGAGGGTDVVARIVGDKMGRSLNQPVIVENRASASGIVGMSTLARAKPDGYTIAFIAGLVITITPHLYKDPQYNVDKDIAPIAVVATSPNMIAANPASGINTLADLISQAKSRPNDIIFAPPFLNSTPHMTGEMLMREAGIKLIVVPYNGSAGASAATIGGQSQITVDALPVLAPFARSGQLKALAVTSRERVPSFPDVPSVSEILPGFEAVAFFAVIAPAGTPGAILDRLNAEVNTAIRDPEVLSKFEGLGLVPRGGSIQQAADYFRDQRERWDKVIQAMGLTPQ